ncbi:MAG: molybdopterin-dependent oxidoreductase [Rhodospirillaceae bacterium]|jgi:DMSO/TMAO reductase YedYZ molybdopterin-dependent catalytic subunit|nr:molybdopterin-dependent oxidoreductase [Rhodospirillaceae bacterium]MBT4773786.1 molybdopterin-dependent oxidoreductase [Rhodospirillaceae bacterium]MBT5768663.1 molybdopterin-dependent oxidoreductase [Rhodospirillaceae bacterium]MBT6311449.1 molybdopterin-dependent oxidoreductase [Rhodospirillaceae bacterium]MBT6537691.1 molybdopterin-dependent oxidoreductase [Rhodospirillaceae bacterium]
MAKTSQTAMAIEGMVREIKLEPSQMTAQLTPAEDLFVLAHMGIPETSAENWTLDIGGHVQTPIRLNYEQLMARPKRVLETVHQCAGSPMNPTLATRRIANVQWGGVDLAELLDEAGISANATHLWSYGMDHGKFAGEVQENYLKDIPLSRLAEGDVLIAYELNGAPLPQKHGFPARLVVPGYFGTNSVKWLSRLEVADRRADSIFTTRFYNDAVPGTEDTRPVWEIFPESLIVAPAPDAVVAAEEIEIWGWAWSATGVERVDVSTDGGDSWHQAEVGPRQQRSWQRFSYQWSPSAAGGCTLMSRATNADGANQPLEGARNAVYALDVAVA